MVGVLLDVAGNGSSRAQHTPTGPNNALQPCEGFYDMYVPSRNFQNDNDMGQRYVRHYYQFQDTQYMHIAFHCLCQT